MDIASQGRIRMGLKPGGNALQELEPNVLHSLSRTKVLLSKPNLSTTTPTKHSKTGDINCEICVSVMVIESHVRITTIRPQLSEIKIIVLNIIIKCE